MKVLGIDPGIAIVGFGVVEKHGYNLTPVIYGKITTPAGEKTPQRLLDISIDIEELMKAYKPDVVAIEKLFFARNTSTAMVVSEARGAILLSVAKFGCPIFEYTPMQIKQSVCGYGGADKNQVQQMVKSLLKLEKIPRPDDVADALAIAITYLESYKLNEAIKGR